jgi:DNA polymerase III epsilon subunit-like protein
LKVGEPYVCIDLETTGLSCYKHEIIEVGAYKFDPTVKEPQVMHGLVKTTRRLPKRIIELTGITDDMIAERGIAPDRGFRQLLEFIGPLPIVTFNASFDLGFLNAAFDRHALTPTKRGGYSCALHLARRTWPGRSSYRLGDLSRLFGRTISQEHRALSDAVRAAHIYQLAKMDRWERGLVGRVGD